MAIQLRNDIVISFIGDGTSTVFSIDLSKDPYVSNAGPLINWFATEKKTSMPVSAVSADSSISSVSLSGTILTMTFSAAPPATSPRSVEISILF
jgi:hypothetical protein